MKSTIALIRDWELLLSPREGIFSETNDAAFAQREKVLRRVLHESLVIAYGFGFRPNNSSLGCPKELTCFHGYSFGLSTDGHGDQDSEDLWKIKFPLPDKILSTGG